MYVRENKNLDAILKEQCQEIFHTFFGSQKSTWAPYEQANTDTCWSSRWLHGHNAGVVIDYADTVTA